MDINGKSQVVKNLLRKRDLLLRRDEAHKDIRSVLLICGGAMRGAYGAGAVAALHGLGLARCFDVVIGVSTGAAIASYFLAGEKQTLIGTSIYYEECLKDFINFLQWPPADVDYIERVMRTGPKMLDVSAIIRHPSQFYVGVTEWNTGKGSFIDVKQALPEPLMAIKASLAITELYRRPVTINGLKLTDGSTALPLPIQKVWETFLPTDMLVIANSPRIYAYKSMSLVRKILGFMVTTGLPSKLRSVYLVRNESRRENLKYLQRNKINAEIFWGPHSLGKLARDYQLIRETVEEGKDDMFATFGQHGRSVNSGQYLV